MSTLLRDLINIPEHTGTNDYVLKLTEGVGHSRIATTIGQYVVTDEIAAAFDQALGLVSAALRSGESRAAFLAGSFGSGKSHFMAVLHALLGHDPQARAIPELHAAIAGHDQALQGTKVLRLAFHFIDAKSVEDTILGGYVAQILALHPGCDLPSVHRGDAVIADAEGLRERLGDDAFFAGLNQHSAAAPADEWSGVVEGTWDGASYDAARAAQPNSEPRRQLVSALVRAYFTAYTQTAEFVSLDEGLTELTRHAKSLGYDAVVMFLDELVLWLAFMVRDRERFGQEAQKITKLVESGTGSRALPLVSFVARQMDLRRYFVDAGGGLGAEQDALDKAFGHQEGRFLTIALGDDNLQYVAERRLLEPLSPAAKDTIDEAFRRLDRRPEVWDTLLDGVNIDETHRGSDQAAFRRTYPFSPALVSTLRTLASAMQRDRTALKVMQELLVRQRDRLTVDDVVPVGDVFDLVVSGNQALTPEMAGRFKNARALYEQKFRPVLLAEHKLAEADVKALLPGHPYLADDRLVKTLVLSAVAPEVPALKDLTGGRLAALNHGSLRSALLGQEASIVLTKVRRWQGTIPEIHIAGEGRDPVIRVRIAEVDYESVVEKARGEDNPGRRRETIKRLVWAALGLSDVDGDAFGVSRQARIWRGSRRDIEVIFGNVRDRSWLSDGAFEAGSDTWRFVVDYPFDEEGHSAREDLNRVESLKASGKTSRTVVWVPHFLGRDVRRELGRLVILDWLLGGSGERWTSHANHLGETERVQAKIILENQQGALRDRLRRAVQEAYGAAAPTPGTLEIDEGHDRVLLSLHSELDPAAPVGHDLAAAFTNLVDQAFTATFPGHPRFEPESTEVRPGELASALAAVEAARQTADGRAFVEPTKRDAVRRVANVLGVGHMGETHFSFDAERFKPWNNHFIKVMGRDNVAPNDPVRVSTLRQWIAEVMPPAGLRTEVADLIICAWAALYNRAWYRGGSPFVPAPKPGSLTADLELRPEPLPAHGEWTQAVERFGKIFGKIASPYLSGRAVAELTEELRTEAGRLFAPARSLVEQLERAYGLLSLPVDAATGRMATARAGRDLLHELVSAHDRVAMVEVLAHHPLPATPEAVSRSLHTAEQLSTLMAAFPWDRLTPVLDASAGSDEASLGARAIVDRLRGGLSADELAQAMSSALKRAEDDVFAWLTPKSTVPVAPGPRTKVMARGSRQVNGPADLAAAVDALRAFADEHPGKRLMVEWRAEP